MDKGLRPTGSWLQSAPSLQASHPSIPLPPKLFGLDPDRCSWQNPLQSQLCSISLSFSTAPFYLLARHLFFSFPCLIPVGDLSDHCWRFLLTLSASLSELCISILWISHGGATFLLINKRTQTELVIEIILPWMWLPAEVLSNGWL